MKIVSVIKNNQTFILVIVCFVLLLVVLQNRYSGFQSNNNADFSLNSKLVKIPELCLGDTCLTEKNLHHTKCKTQHYIYNPGNPYRRYESSWDSSSTWTEGALYSSYAWIAHQRHKRHYKHDSGVTLGNTWMQINSPELLTVGGIAMQTRREGHWFTKTYRVKYAITKKDKDDYEDDDFIMVDNGREYMTDLGRGNYYWRDLSKIFFSEPIKCYAIRIYPYAYHHAPAMRAGLIVCGTNPEVQTQ